MKPMIGNAINKSISTDWYIKFNFLFYSADPDLRHEPASLRCCLSKWSLHIYSRGTSKKKKKKKKRKKKKEKKADKVISFHFIEIETKLNRNLTQHRFHETVTAACGAWKGLTEGHSHFCTSIFPPWLKLLKKTRSQYIFIGRKKIIILVKSWEQRFKLPGIMLVPTPEGENYHPYPGPRGPVLGYQMTTKWREISFCSFQNNDKFV